MQKFMGILLGLFVAYGVPSTAAQAAGFPVVISTTVNSTSGTLTINGQNFGSNPVVTLNSTTFAVMSTSSTQIVAAYSEPEILRNKKFTKVVRVLSEKYRYIKSGGFAPRQCLKVTCASNVPVAAKAEQA